MIHAEGLISGLNLHSGMREGVVTTTRRELMTQEKWTAVDHYISDVLLPPDPVLDAVLQASDVAGLPPHNVAPNQGKLLMLLALIDQAHNILEIGTLGGYSTIWLARAFLPTVV